MSPRQSKTGSRAAGRTRGARGSKRAGRGSSHSLSAGRDRESNTRRAGSARGAASARRGASGGRNSRGGRASSAAARRSGSSASYAVKLLKQDHRAVEQALEQFQSAAREQKQAIARRICRMLTVHEQIEEELLYAPARDALDPDDAHLIAEALVEQATLKDLIRQIEDREPVDEQYEAKVRVLGEYTKHHAGEEEHEVFPRLERSSLDLQAIGERMQERKRELTGELGETAHEGQALPEDEEEGASRGGRSHGGRSHRPAGLHARPRGR